MGDEIMEIEREEEIEMENGKKGGFWKKVALGAAGVVGGIIVLAKLVGRKSTGDQDSIEVESCDSSVEE